LIGNSSRLIWHGDASRIPFFWARFDHAFILLPSYRNFLLHLFIVSKILVYIDVLSFMMISLLASSVYYDSLYNYERTFYRIYWYGNWLYSTASDCCQLMACISISYATQHMQPWVS
jgi:hypothetical protein